MALALALQERGTLNLQPRWEHQRCAKEPRPAAANEAGSGTCWAVSARQAINIGLSHDYRN